MLPLPGEIPGGGFLVYLHQEPRAQLAGAHGTVLIPELLFHAFPPGLSQAGERIVPQVIEKKRSFPV